TNQSSSLLEQSLRYYSCLFFYTATPTSEISTLSLHDALPISTPRPPACTLPGPRGHDRTGADVEAALGGRGPARAAAARGRDPSGTGGAADAGDRGGAEVLGGDGAGAPPPRAHNAQEDDGDDLTWGHRD